MLILVCSRFYVTFYRSAGALSNMQTLVDLGWGFFSSLIGL